MTRQREIVRQIFAGPAVVLLIAAAVLRAQITKPIAGDPVKTDVGPVSGTMSTDGLKTYFGIPFAAPAIRENRWRAPQPVTPWQGVLTANRKPAFHSGSSSRLPTRIATRFVPISPTSAAKAAIGR